MIFKCCQWTSECRGSRAFCPAVGDPDNLGCTIPRVAAVPGIRGRRAGEGIDFLAFVGVHAFADPTASAIHSADRADIRFIVAEKFCVEIHARFFRFGTSPCSTFAAAAGFLSRLRSRASMMLMTSAPFASGVSTTARPSTFAWIIA